MFTSPNVRFHIAKAALRTEELKKDERFPVLAVALVLEPLTRELALELGPEIADHCFTRAGKIRDEMTRVQVRLRDKPQVVTARMAEDSPDPSVIFRHVRINQLTVTKRGPEPDAKEATQGKKVAPQVATLRATVSCLIDPSEKAHREFICGFIYDTFLFSFQPEQKDLFAEMWEESQGADGDTKADDGGAGDVLDDQSARDAEQATGGR